MIWFLWDCYVWCKVRLFPDPRTAKELLAEAKSMLSQLPASKEIHEVYAELEKVEAGCR